MSRKDIYMSIQQCVHWKPSLMVVVGSGGGWGGGGVTWQCAKCKSHLLGQDFDVRDLSERPARSPAPVAVGTD